MTTPPVPDPAIIAAYQALSQALAGPITPGAAPSPIPTRAQPTITDVQPPQAAVNDPVTITGTDLGSTSKVFIGNQEATITGATTPTQVTFEPDPVPKGTTARITVTTDLGWVLSPTDFTVTEEEVG
jgi:hypothetical protein